jgi:hypothetical protein
METRRFGCQPPGRAGTQISLSPPLLVFSSLLLWRFVASQVYNEAVVVPSTWDVARAGLRLGCAMADFLSLFS